MRPISQLPPGMAFAAGVNSGLFVVAIVMAVSLPSDEYRGGIVQLRRMFHAGSIACYNREMLLARAGSRSSFLAKFRYFDVMARTASCNAYGLTGFSRR
jgi:hypothetical protein